MSFLLTFSSLASLVASGLYGTLLAMIVNIRRSFLPVAGDMLAYCGMSTFHGANIAFLIETGNKIGEKVVKKS